MRILRKILIITILVSLLLVPYSFFAYLCYLGLCGGGESHAIGMRFTSFYGYFSWIYFLIAIFSLIFSHILNKKNHAKISLGILYIPLIALIPYIYVEINAEIIHQEFQKKRLEYYSPRNEDFVCAPGKFIRYENEHYYYFNYDNTYSSGTMTFYKNLDALKNEFKQNKIDILICKNKNNLSIERGN